MLRRPSSDFRVNVWPMEHRRRDQLARQRGGILVPFLLGEMTFQHGVRGPLTEVRFEDRRQGESAAGSAAADPVSRRRHQRGL